MNLTRAAINNNRITFTLLVVLVFAGLSSYRGMPQAQDPGFTIRAALVMTEFPGASPARVEQLVTDKLEKVIQEIPELDTIVSQSKPGISIITVNFQERYTDMRPIFDNLRRKVERAANDLPQGAATPRVDDEFGDVFSTLVTLVGDGYSYAELEDVSKQVRDELLLIDDVAKVDVYGVQDERIFVEYTNARLAELGLSPQQLRGILSARNIIDSGGDLRTASEQIVLEPSGDFSSVEDLRRALIPMPQGDLLPLRDIASVTRDYIDPPRSKVRVDGEAGILLGISMREGGNVVELGDEIRITIDRLTGRLPHGIDLSILQDGGEIVDVKVQSFVSNLLQSVGIVMLVMLLSLGLRTGLVVATLIPMAIIMAFIFMPMWDVGIDQMSLAALIIALGLLVDNAIVMSESILVRMREGQPPLEAAVGSANELSTSLLISSLTTAAAFLPIYLAESAVGEYTGALFKVVTITLLSSWVLAMTMIPLLCYMFLKVKKQEGGSAYDSKFYRIYRKLLLQLLRRPLISLACVFLVFYGSLMLFRFVPVIFFPDDDRPTLTAQIKLPYGTPLAATEEVIEQIETYIATDLLVGQAEPLPPSGGVLAWLGRLLGLSDEQPNGVTDYTTFLGNGGPRFYLGHDPEQSSPAYALMMINTTTRRSTDWVVDKLRAKAAEIPSVQATIEPLATGPPGGKPIAVRISGREYEEVFDLVDQFKAYLASIEGPIDINDNWGARSKKFLVNVDDDRAQRAGVTNEDVALSLKSLLSGYDATTYREGDKVIPVLLRSNQARGTRIDRFGSINVFSQSTGQSVPIEQVADAEVAWQPANIQRRDRLQTVTVDAELLPGYASNVLLPDIEAWLDEQSVGWPLGYSYEIGGEDEASREANESIGVKLPISGLLIVLLLVAQFNSFRRPAIILLTIPLGLIGVVIGLIVLRGTFGFMTLLGIISLAGIVINNAIVLIDRIGVEIENGHSPERAVIESAQRRLRPILLTTFTTLGGMIPLYLGGGPLFESMAAAIMFGLIFATLLTLGVVPILYTLFFRLQYRQFRYEDAA
ncbi:MAG: efflux RND transporter permease subunit [Acidobacteriota bacterium]